METLAAYLRTSTDSQDEGLDTQRDQISRWAEGKGLSISAWYTDQGISGSNGLETRLALAEALSSGASGIVVYKLDRLARDLVIQETVLGQARRQGIRIYSTLAAEDAYLLDDPLDPTRKLIRQVLGAISDYDRAMTRLRMKAGADRKKARTGWCGGGVPFGYRVNPLTHDLEPDPSEQETLAMMKALEGSLSLRGIAQRLDQAGKAPRKGKSWHPHSVSRVLAANV